MVQAIAHSVIFHQQWLVSSPGRPIATQHQSIVKVGARRGENQTWRPGAVVGGRIRQQGMVDRGGRASQGAGLR